MEKLSDKHRTYFRRDPADFLFPFALSLVGFFLLAVMQRIRESEIVCPTTAPNGAGWVLWGIGTSMLYVFLWRCFRWDRHVNKPISPRKRWKWIVVLVGATLGWFGTFEFLREMRPQAFEVTVGGNQMATVTTQAFVGGMRVGCIELPLAHGMPPVATLTREFASAVWKLQPPYTAVTIRWHHVKVIADGSSCTYNGKQVLRIPIQIYPTYPGKGGVQ